SRRTDRPRRLPSGRSGRLRPRDDVRERPCRTAMRDSPPVPTGLGTPAPTLGDAVPERLGEVVVMVLPVAGDRREVAVQRRPHGLEAGEAEGLVDRSDPSDRLPLEFLEFDLAGSAFRNPVPFLEEGVVHLCVGGDEIIVGVEASPGLEPEVRTYRVVEVLGR